MSPKPYAGPAILALLPLISACGADQQPAPDQTEELAQTELLPPGHPPLDQTDATTVLPAPVMSDDAALTWVRPPGWVGEPPANPMRQAQYSVPGPAGEALCVVYYFGAGQGGGPEANAQRWADQFEQPDGSSSRDVLETRQTEVNGMPTLLVKVAGTYKEGGMAMTGTPQQTRPDYMLHGAIVQGPDANWFFKFTGPKETVRANAEQFRALIDSVQGPT